jgi:phage protein U
MAKKKKKKKASVAKTAIKKQKVKIKLAQSKSAQKAAKERDKAMQAAEKALTAAAKKKAAKKTAAASGIGSFGKTIVFEASANKVLPFSGMKREVGGRWKEHDIIGKKPKSEFCGPEAQEVKMTVTLSAEHGVKPRETMEKIVKACESGIVENLIIGGKVIAKMRIVSVSEAWERVLNKGELLKATLEITFKEYS